MEYLEIKGGRPLAGEVRVQGSKNAVLPILSAAMLGKGTMVIRNCPAITDVTAMLEILETCGCKTRWEGQALVLNPENLNSGRIPAAHAGRMRSSVMLLGSLLGKVGQVCLPCPGGCVIGKRPMDLHLQALKQMGAVIFEEQEGLCASCVRAKGAVIRLPYPSVGATENVILLAVTAEGETVLQNAAREPEIGELCRFLRQMGAEIHGEGTGILRIEGGRPLAGTEFTVMSDRIVAGTYLFLGAAAGGEILLKDAPVGQLQAVFPVLRRLGAQIETEEGQGILRLRSFGRLRGGTDTTTLPYPGFPTDLQSPLLAALCLADGESRVRETVFEARFQVAEELRKLGAQVAIWGNEAVVTGQPALHGTELHGAELRGSAALCIAAAAAEGTSRVFGTEYLSRGYENIIRDLQALGVMIQ